MTFLYFSLFNPKRQLYMPRPRMSILLAQVIYALNTKNDEHEAAIATLKEAHEEEVQQILSETRENILQVGSHHYIKKRSLPPCA